MIEMGKLSRVVNEACSSGIMRADVFGARCDPAIRDSGYCLLRASYIGWEGRLTRVEGTREWQQTEGVVTSRDWFDLNPHYPRDYDNSLLSPLPRPGRVITQYSRTADSLDDLPSAAEVSLPWRRGADGGMCFSLHLPIATDTACQSRCRSAPTPCVSALATPPGDPSSGDLAKKLSKESEGGDSSRVTTPTATETMLPWKRDDEGESTFPVKQSEFPAWCSNKEYLAYSSPSATFLGNIGTTDRHNTACFSRLSYTSETRMQGRVRGIEQPKMASVIGLFRRESSGSGHDSHGSSSETSLHQSCSVESPRAPGTVLLIEESPLDTPTSLGVQKKIDLLARVMVDAQQIDGTPRVMERVYRNIIRSYNVCNDIGDRHIEPLL
ncbi:hypothetical protein PR048_000081 [Dryococelus australis]|uniref:Uncharacterized protein n=1 Tax=Dryococelus australis TaxID=614101 RepID=A0ABQ9IEU9_9NEOP|nr:hypothetical protein PR048_000081 [Dryococelus australis]